MSARPERDQPVQRVGVDLVADHEREARGGRAGLKLLQHRAEDAVGFLDLPQQAWIAARAEQEGQPVGALRPVGERAQGHLTGVGRQIEQHRRDVLDRRQALGEHAVVQGLRVRHGVVDRQGPHAHRVRRVGLQLDRLVLLLGRHPVGRVASERDVLAEDERPGAIELALQPEIVGLLHGLAVRREEPDDADGAPVRVGATRPAVGVGRLDPQAAAVVRGMADDRTEPWGSKC